MKYFTLFIFLISGCAFLVKPEKTIEKNDTLILPDYSNLSFWAAHPEKKDNADLVPDSSLSDRQEFASADVFYIHPTTLIQAKYWNGDLTDSVLNDRTDEGTIKPQASIFNDCCKVYAPRYRQAAIYAFLKETKEGKQALDFAYEDVKKAFEYYARNLNKGRPWILAGHSQGALHSIRLLKEVISNSDIGKSMVAAYVLGWPFRGEEIGFPICKSQEDIRCVIGWNTYVWGNYPSQRKELYNGAVCVNPLSWKADNEYMPKEKNLGSLPKGFNRIIPTLADAKCEDGILWVNSVSSEGFPTLEFGKNYHLVDFHLFYMNIRENSKLRIKSFPY